MPENEYTADAAVIMQNEESQKYYLLIVKKTDGQITLPGGHYDHERESSLQGAIREVEEETGIRVRDRGDAISLGNYYGTGIFHNTWMFFPGSVPNDWTGWNNAPGDKEEIAEVLWYDLEDRNPFVRTGPSLSDRNTNADIFNAVVSIMKEEYTDEMLLVSLKSKIPELTFSDKNEVKAAIDSIKMIRNQIPEHLSGFESFAEIVDEASGMYDDEPEEEPEDIEEVVPPSAIESIPADNTISREKAIRDIKRLCNNLVADLTYILQGMPQSRFKKPLDLGRQDSHSTAIPPAQVNPEKIKRSIDSALRTLRKLNISIDNIKNHISGVKPLATEADDRINISTKTAELIYRLVAPKKIGAGVRPILDIVEALTKTLDTKYDRTSRDEMLYALISELQNTVIILFNRLKKIEESVIKSGYIIEEKEDTLGYVKNLDLLFDGLWS